MKQEQTKQNAKMPKWLNYTISGGFSLIAIGLMGWLMVYVLPETIRGIKQSRYVMSHLDPNAVSPKENPFRNNFVDLEDVVYEDPDRDGENYNSILKWKNSDGKIVDIPIRKGLEGKIEFPNLSETAVDPLHLPRNPWGLKVDYVHINGDGKLESVTYFGLDDKNPQRMKVEIIDGKYVLSNL